MSKFPQKICRICEQKTAAKLIDISLENNFQSLIPKFLACADVTFDITDELPKFFCRNCISTLNIAYSFKIKCEQTQKKFQTLLQCKIPLAESSLISLKIENAEEPISYENNIVDTNLTLEQIFEYSSNLVEVEIEPSELKFECIDHESIDYEETEKLDLIDENYQYIICESNDDNSEKCPICFKEFKIKSSLTRHITENHKHSEVHPPSRKKNKRYVDKITAYECFMCNDSKTFANKRTLLRHMNSIHISKEMKPLFRCEICGKNFQCNANKNRHIKVVHLNERSFVCRVCGHRFGSLYELENHEPNHSNETNFECTHCTEKFRTKLHLQKHYRIAHYAPETKELKVVTYEERLKREIAIVQRRRDYNDARRECCELCGKTMMVGHLKRHILKHSGIKPYKCQLCPKSFFHKHTLNAHELVHSGEKPYKCEICSKTFRQISHLLRHRLTHTGEKPYKCRFCEKSFATSGNFKEHERLHTGEKPYQCNLCTEKFGNSKALKRHAAKMHAGRESEALIYTLPPPGSHF